MKQRAFSLIELLVVIAIIAVLAGLALPGLMGSRRTAQLAVSQANMRSMNGVITSFTTDNKGQFPGPFGANQRTSGSAEAGYSFGFQTHSRYTGDGFMAYWFSYMASQSLNSGLSVQAFASPADGDVMRAVRAGGAATESLLAGSFYYSPTFYRPPESYSFTIANPPCCPSDSGPQYRGDCCDATCQTIPCSAAKLGIEMVSSPSAKVILYERADFFQRSRTKIDGATSIPQPLSPAWNNPRARLSVCTVDGAIVRPDVGELTRRAADALANDRTLTLLPVDLLNVPDTMPQLFHTDLGNIDGMLQTDGTYPMLFAATRNGIRGRDLAQ